MMRFVPLLLASAALAQPPGPPVLNRVRYFPARGGEQAMVGGRFLGSNTSATTGFEVLAIISRAPAADKSGMADRGVSEMSYSAGK